jgi:hypothetical protein
MASALSSGSLNGPFLIPDALLKKLQRFPRKAILIGDSGESHGILYKMGNMWHFEPVRQCVKCIFESDRTPGTSRSF